MNIFGREYGFRLSVGAAMEISALCPDKKLENIDKLLVGEPLEIMDKVFEIAEIESRAFEQARAFETGEEIRPHFQKEIGKNLDFAQFTELSQEVQEAFRMDMKPTVEVDPEAAKKKEETAGSEEQPSGSN